MPRQLTTDPLSGRPAPGRPDTRNPDERKDARRAKHGPRRLTITVPPHLTPALDALATLDGRPRSAPQAIVCAALAEAQRDATVQGALRRSGHQRGDLHLVGTRPATR